MTVLKKYIKVLLLLIAAAGTTLLVVKRQVIADYIRLRNYTPPARIAALADSTTMVTAGRRYFYVGSPTLLGKAEFTYHCKTYEQTIVLGCYISPQTIYLLDVDDPRLNGVDEVTAAHEMLHSAYDRLGGSEKKRINNLINEAYSKLNDERIKKNVEAYRKRDANVVPSELHSILATEVARLPAALEDYYSRYFQDRSVVVAFSKQYEAAFSQRQNAIAEYDSQLAKVKNDLETAKAAVDPMTKNITAERARLERLLVQGQTNEYNASVPGFNLQVREYNNHIQLIRSLIERYNNVVTERNAVAAEQQDLVDALSADIPEQLPQ